MIYDTGTQYLHRYSVFTPVLGIYTDTWHVTLDIWFMTPAHGIYTGTCHAIFDTRYPTPVLTMLHLLLDIRHRYLPCYIWHMIPDTGTYHATLITWYLTPVLAMLYLLLDIWHRYLTCYICHLIYNTWYLAPVLPGIFMIIMWPDIWHSCISCTHVFLYLLNSCTPELLYSWTPWKRVTPDIILLVLYSCFRKLKNHGYTVYTCGHYL